MDWINNLFSNKRTIPFWVKVTINDLKNVPFQSGLYYAKWKLIGNGSGNSSGMSYHMPIKQNTVVFNTEFEFQANIVADKSLNLERTNLMIVIKQDLQVNGSKAIEKIGSCFIDLAELAPPCPSSSKGDAVPEAEAITKRYLLSDSKLNAILSVSIQMRLIRSASVESAAPNLTSTKKKRSTLTSQQPQNGDTLLYYIPQHNANRGEQNASTNLCASGASLVANYSNSSMVNAAQFGDKNESLANFKGNSPLGSPANDAEALGHESPSSSLEPAAILRSRGQSVGVRETRKSPINTSEQANYESTLQSNKVPLTLTQPGNLMLKLPNREAKSLKAPGTTPAAVAGSLPPKVEAESGLTHEPRSLLTSPVAPELGGASVSPATRKQTLKTWSGYDAKEFSSLLSPPELPDNPFHQRQASYIPYKLAHSEKASSDAVDSPAKLQASDQTVSRRLRASRYKKFSRSHPFQQVLFHTDADHSDSESDAVNYTGADESPNQVDGSYLKPPFLPNLPSEKLVRIIFEYAIYDVKTLDSLPRAPPQSVLPVSHSDNWKAVLPQNTKLRYSGDSRGQKKLPSALQSHEKAAASFRQSRAQPKLEIKESSPRRPSIGELPLPSFISGPFSELPEEVYRAKDDDSCKSFSTVTSMQTI